VCNAKVLKVRGVKYSEKMVKVYDGETILETEEEIDNFAKAIKKENVDKELIAKALLLNKKVLYRGSSQCYVIVYL